jgi:hypothetical protein
MREDPSISPPAPPDNAPPLPVPAPPPAAPADAVPPPVAGPVHPAVPNEDTTLRPVNEWMQDA